MTILEEIDNKMLNYIKEFDKIPSALFLSKDCYNVLKYFLEIPADQEITKFKKRKNNCNENKTIRIELLRKNITKTLFLI